MRGLTPHKEYFLTLNLFVFYKGFVVDREKNWSQLFVSLLALGKISLASSFITLSL